MPRTSSGQSPRKRVHPVGQALGPEHDITRALLREGVTCDQIDLMNATRQCILGPCALEPWGKPRAPVALRVHLVSHLSDQCPFEYQCTKCPYRSRYKGDVRVHEESHSRPGFRPRLRRTREACPSTFFADFNLTRHGELDYSNIHHPSPATLSHSSPPLQVLPEDRISIVPGFSEATPAVVWTPSMDRRSLPSDPQTPVISPGDTQDHLENDCGLYLPDDLPSARFNNLLGSLPALENDNTRGHLHSCDSLGQDATITGPDRSILSGLQGSFQSHLYDLSDEDTPFSVEYGPRSYRPDAQGGSPVEPGTALSLENLDPWGAFYDPDALARNTGMMRPDPNLFLDPSYSVQHYLHNAPEEYQSEISTSSSPVQYRLQPYLPDTGGAGPAQRSAGPSYGRYTCQFYFEDEAAGQQGDLMSPATVHSDSDRSSFPGSTPDAAWRFY